MMEDLSLHILDIAENAISAGASRIAITIAENERRDALTIRVTDNGAGMSREMIGRAFDPFFSTKGKRTGLGIPLLVQMAEHCGGRVTITSDRQGGTNVFARFRLHHIDRPPLTNMKGTMTTLIFGHPEIGFRYVHRRNGEIFRFASRRYFKTSGTLSWANPDLISRIREDLQTGLKRLGRS